MNKKILLLEDDTLLGETLEELLQQEGYEVSLVTSGNEAIDESYENNFDLYVFDINVPDISGLELLESLRDADDKTPTIFISALVDLNSISKAFEIGADDYIKKPFDFDELLVRIHAILRKQYNSYKDKITAGDFHFMIEKNELYHGRTFVALPPYELKLALLFFRQLDRTLSKEYLLQQFYDGKEMSDGSLRVHINKLRKIGLPIVTVKGIGYRLASS